MASSKNGTKNESTKTAESGAASVAEAPAVKQDPDAKQDSVVVAGTGTEKKPEPRESVYTVDEFCSNAKSLFNTMPECVRAALKEKGIEQCSKTEAEKTVMEFMKKEVK